MVMVSPSKSAMVRLMPSTATEPFGTIQGRTFSGTRTLRVQSVVCLSNCGLDAGMTGSRAVMMPQPSTWPWTMWPPRGLAGGGGQFEIDACAGGERAEGGFVEGFLGEVGVEERWVYVEGGEADAGDGERVAFAETGGEAGGFDGETADAACVLEADDGAGLLDDAGEHGFILRERGRQRQELRLVAGFFHGGIEFGRGAGEGAVGEVEAEAPAEDHAEGEDEEEAAGLLEREVSSRSSRARSSGRRRGR